MSLDWQADRSGDDFDPGQPGRPHRARSWILVVATVVAVLFAVAVRETGRRLARASEQTNEDVRAGDSLVRRAAAAGDEELFFDLLSGRDPAWTQIQKNLLDAKLLFGQAGRPLGLQPAPAPSTVVSVTLSPELDEATLLLRHSYRVTTAVGVSRTVQLEQPIVYRKGERSWLLSPPKDEFWGEWRTTRTDNLTVTFPTRDGALVRRLAADLSVTLGGFCERLEIECADDPRFGLILTNDPESLLLLGEGLETNEPALQLSLPAPTLVGRPAGATADAAYDALFRGYASPLLRAVAKARLDFKCCDGAPYFEALLRRLLSESGVATWPVSRADQLAFVDSPVPAIRFEDFWREERFRAEPPTRVEWGQIYAFIPFIEAAYDIPPGRQLRLLLAADSFWAWLRAISEEESSVIADYLGYLYEEAGALYGAPATEAADDLYLLCTDEARGFGLYRYGLRDAHWTWLAPAEGQVPTLHPHSNRDALLIYEVLDERLDRPPSRLWLDGELVSLDPSLRPVEDLPPDPAGRYLPFWKIPSDGQDPIETVLLDLQACRTEAGCATIPLPGLPVWSPSGARLLAWDVRDGRLYYGERRLLEADSRAELTATGVRAANVPVWLDEEHFSYVDEDAWRVKVRSRDGAESDTVVTIDELLASFSREENRQLWSIRAAVAVPTAPGVYLVVAVPRSAGLSRQLFLVDTEATGEPVAEPLVYLSASASSRLLDGLSPSLPWLALNPAASLSRGNRFVLYDLRSRQTRLDADQPFFLLTRPISWSPGGERLARLGFHLLELITPAADGLHRQFIFTDNLQCTAIVWAGENGTVP